LYNSNKGINNYKEQENSNNKGEDNNSTIEEDNNAMFAEDNYESMISNLGSLVACIDQDSIHEIWNVTTIEQNKEHFVIIYGNANHLCTCMFLVTKGLVCRHFFTVLFNSDKAMFHIGLIPPRWYNEMTLDPQQEVAITVHNKKHILDNEFAHKHKIDTNFDGLNKIRYTQEFSETVKKKLSHKVKYNQGFGYAKRAINLALEIGCEDELNTLLQHWVRDKEKEIHVQNESELNKEILPNITNPYQA